MIIILLSFILFGTSCIEPKKLQQGYKLVWNDEFNYNGKLDSTKWNYEYGFIRNKEPQYYQQKNATCLDGKLIIEAKKEMVANDSFKANSENWRYSTLEATYTSACAITKGRMEFLYGRVIMRAKIDVAQGQWPAFWMLGLNRGPVSWPACGEVDIMEFYRKKLYANAFWKGKNSETGDVNFISLDSLRKRDKNWENNYHIWKMDWDSNFIKIYVDEHLLNEIDLSKTINYPTENDNPFHKKFYLLINLALGQGKENIPDSTLPSKLYVDYVRVYQLK